MTITHILIFCFLSILLGLLPRRGRDWLLFLTCVISVYILQPASTIRYLDFWLPTAALGLIAAAWAASLPAGDLRTRVSRQDLAAFALMAAVPVVIGAAGASGLELPAGPAFPPPFDAILPALAVSAGIAVLSLAFSASNALQRRIAVFWILILISLLLVLKVADLSTLASAWLRWFNGQETAIASALDIRWLGFSYLAFRLIHTLRDRVTGRLPALSLRAYVTYAVFFPALTAGPIDRAERFDRDLNRTWRLDLALVGEAGQRIVVGIFKKFVLADSLSLVALNPQNAVQVSSGGWLWVLLYLYAFQIFFDFSGYTDIAIGIGMLVGIRLPENFQRPYLQRNLTVFWNNWHMTLTQWLRAYIFNPLMRSLRAREGMPAWLALVICQTVTMFLVGIWHGVTWNFAIWGLWHAFGLFIHNRWVDTTRPYFASLEERPHLQKVLHISGVLITFHYVTLGWIWFCLPMPQLAWETLLRLLRIG